MRAGPGGELPLFETTPLLHGAFLSVGERQGRKKAFSSPVETTGRSATRLLYVHATARPELFFASYASLKELERPLRTRYRKTLT